MTVVHTVLLRFKEDAGADQVKMAIADLLDLKVKCVRADTKQPYMQVTSGGKDNSVEGLRVQQGFQYAFVMEFESTADRDYYAKSDPAHQAYVKTYMPIFEKVIVFDYSKMEF
ncbi:hypothetical protein M406DRAFT_34253 [Cryphonectria parasitica EP155]|uniref:Stress-response A/B barrel domain-containing protein n=1 Tax=Cryphonectria parasitica (strain ATCC 38755 / EP155) TaxID=660469 RepID=A0A9P5CVL9_CRYP1|nr:uncharacterized protein M406DRAFT_34253 [Cryphonectria parasitica EP155]KAF3770780.1 hypothetical protein M406DRAFT_34253 [Cryphonectria parasitica EP155]